MILILIYKYHRLKVLFEPDPALLLSANYDSHSANFGTHVCRFYPYELLQTLRVCVRKL